MPATDTASPDSRFLIATTDYIVLDDELIVFSVARQQYFGIEGAGQLVWAALDRESRPMSQAEIVNLVLADREPSANALALVREAIGMLLDLGVLRET